MEFKRNYILIPSQLCAKPRIAPKEEVCVGNVHDYTSVKLDSDEKPPRKKACLTHMSDDEKNLRRKMKNRESAQSARDRKKNYVDSLEKRVQELVAEKETLLQAKLFVDQRNQNLEKENSLLREKLNGARQGSLGTKMDEKSDSYHWEKVCRQLMTEKEDLCAKLRDLEDQLACKVTQPVLELTSGGNSDQLEHFYPIEATEVEVKTSEESSESAAEPLSSGVRHFDLSSPCGTQTSNCLGRVYEIVESCTSEGKGEQHISSLYLHGRTDPTRWSSTVGSNRKRPLSYSRSLRGGQLPCEDGIQKTTLTNPLTNLNCPHTPSNSLQDSLDHRYSEELNDLIELNTNGVNADLIDCDLNRLDGFELPTDLDLQNADLSLFDDLLT